MGVKAGKPSPLRQVLFASLRWEVAEVAGQLLLVLASRWSPSPAPLARAAVEVGVEVGRAPGQVGVTLSGRAHVRVRVGAQQQALVVQ